MAIVTTSYPRAPGDAAGHFVAAEARLLTDAGHDVTVFAAGAGTSNEPGPVVVWLEDGGATGWPGLVPRLRESPLRALGLARWVWRARHAIVARGPFDRVVAQWLFPAAFPLALTLPPSSRLEVVVHGSDARLLARLPRRLARTITTRLARRGARFRCVSEELAATLRATGGAGELDVRVEPAPIRLEGVLPRESARLALGVAETSRLILVVARLVPEKRVRDALAAARLIPDADVVVLGDGPERAGLVAEHPRVRFLGRLPREEALLWMAASDVLLSASRLEGAPTTIREARALGVPVVTTKAGDLKRWAESDPGLFVID